MRREQAAARNHNQTSQDDTGDSPIEQEMERLWDRLILISTLEARNEARSSSNRLLLESFIDQHYQWDALCWKKKSASYCRASKDVILWRIEVLSEELI
jgi:hypothetical protein